MNSRPVFKSEVRKIARQTRTYAFRTAFLLLVLLVGALTVRMTLKYASRYSDLQSVLPRLGKQIYFGLVFTMGGAVILLSPVYAGGIITGERERQTLDIVLASDLSSLEIVSDKLLSQIAFIGSHILGVLPLCFGCMMLGGVSWWQLVGGISLVMGLLLFCAGIGIFFSTIGASTTRAVVNSYIAIAVYLVGIPLFLVLAAESRFWSDILSEEVVIPLILLGNHGGAFGVLVWGMPPVGTAGLLAALTRSSWIVVTGISVLLFLSATAFAAIRLRSESPQRLGWKERRWWRRKKRRRRSLRRVWANPVLWRTACSGGGGRWLRILLFGYLALATVADPRCFWYADFHRATICGEICLLLVFLSTEAAASVSVEREKRTLSALLSTPLGSTRVIAGKALGIVLRHGLWLLLPICHTSACVIGGLFLPGSIYGVSMSLLVLGSLFLVLSLFVSTLHRSSRRAVFLSVAVFFLAVALMPLLFAMLDAEDLAELSPIGVVVSGIEIHRPSRRYEWPAMFRKPEFACALIAYAVVAAACGGILLRKSEGLLRLHL